MMRLLSAEWIRFIRNPLNTWVIAVFFALLTVSAIASGLAADTFREQTLQRPHKSANLRTGPEMHDAPRAAEAGQAGSSALATGNAATTLKLPALGGLALSIRQIDLSGSEISVSIRGRHTDGRNGDSLFNPLLRELGVLDFAAILALLLPLTVIGLAYGLVQEDRERGVWRLVCAQMTRPWLLVFAALAVRLMAVLIPAVAASLLAFALDSGSTPEAALQWLAFIAVFTGVWIMIAGLFLLLPVSSGATAVGMLGVWLIATFAVPAGLNWAANSHQAMPSRLAAIVDIRRLQEQTSRQRIELLSAWYRAHPGTMPQAFVPEPPRDVAALPSNLELDGKVRPLMYRFDATRKAHFEFMEQWSALSPGLAAVLMGDRLAGIDAPRHADYIQAVNQFEDQWRAFFVPRIMNHENLSAEEAANPPVFRPDFAPAETAWPLTIKQLLSGCVLLALLIALRKRFAMP